MPDITGVLFFLAILGYGVAAALYALALALALPKLVSAAFGTLCGASAGHAVVIGLHLAGQGRLPVGSSVGPVAGGWDHPFATIAWMLAAVLCVAGIRRAPVRVIGAFLAPVALALTLGAVLVGPRAESAGFLPDVLRSAWFPIHILCVYSSMALFALAFGAGIGYLGQHGRLKRRAIPPDGSAPVRLPPLEVLDRVIHRCFAWGLAALTGGIVTGTFQAIAGGARGVDLRPKIAVTLGLWVVYVLGWQARSLLGWGGRRTAWLAVLGFVGVLVSIAVVAHT